MSCIPLFNKYPKCRFEVTVKLHSLGAVPYVNSTTFAKLRLQDVRNSTQYSPRADIRNNTVIWNSEHRFHCKFKCHPETNILEPYILKVSIRMETKGGKSFQKVGFVGINLTCFAAFADVITRRRYILEGYDEKRKRQDNSLLSVSFYMRQTFGDCHFRVPAENLGNCLVEPSEPLDNILPNTNNNNNNIQNQAASEVDTNANSLVNYDARPRIDCLTNPQGICTSTTTVIPAVTTTAADLLHQVDGADKFPIIMVDSPFPPTPIGLRTDASYISPSSAMANGSRNNNAIHDESAQTVETDYSYHTVVVDNEAFVPTSMAQLNHQLGSSTSLGNSPSMFYNPNIKMRMTPIRTDGALDSSSINSVPIKPSSSSITPHLEPDYYYHYYYNKSQEFINPQCVNTTQSTKIITTHPQQQLASLNSYRSNSQLMDYFATDSVLLCQTSRLRRNRPNVQSLLENNGTLPVTIAETKPGITTSNMIPIKDCALHGGNVQMCHGGVQVDLDFTTRSLENCVDRKQDPSNQDQYPSFNQNNYLLDNRPVCLSSGYQSHSRQSSLDMQPIKPQTPSVDDIVQTAEDSS